MPFSFASVVVHCYLFIMEKHHKDVVKIVVDPGHFPPVSTAKMTKQKRLEFLEEFAKDYNISKAASRIGVTRETIQRLKRNDPKFLEAFNRVKDAYLDAVESAGFAVALQPSREGFNDRKLMLQSYRPERYSPHFTINQNVKIDARVVKADLTDALQRFTPSIRHLEVSDNNEA